MKKTKKKHRARMRLEQAWAWQVPGGRGAPWVVPSVRPLDPIEPSDAGTGSWADEADSWVDEAELALDLPDTAAYPWTDEREFAAVAGEPAEAAEAVGTAAEACEADRAAEVNAAGVDEADEADEAGDADEADEAVGTSDASDPAQPTTVAHPDRPAPSPVADASPEDRDLGHDASSIERHDPASDPPAQGRRPEPLVIRGLNNGTPRAWTHQDGDLARKTLLTAGPDAGSWVGAIAGTSDATADILFNIYLGDGLADYLVGAATVPAGAGTGTIPAVNLLADAGQLPWVSTEGSFTIPAGWQVRFENATALTAGTVTLVPFGGDY